VIEFDFTIHGDRRVQRGFAELGRKADDLRDPLDQIGEQILADVEQDFRTKGHGKWKPLDPDYKAWKAREFPGRPMLHLTGELHREMTSRTAVHVGPNRLVYEAKVDRWKLEGRPVRPDVHRREIDDIFHRWLADTIREAFPGREA
jgi:phage gpG-like protein